MDLTPKKITAVTGIFFLLTGSFQVPLSYAIPESSVSNVSLPADLSQIAVPSEIGKIQDIYKANQEPGTKNQEKDDFPRSRFLAPGSGFSPVVILIQDAHAIPDAQRNIETLFSFLAFRTFWL